RHGRRGEAEASTRDPALARCARARTSDGASFGLVRIHLRADRIGVRIRGFARLIGGLGGFVGRRFKLRTAGFLVLRGEPGAESRAGLEISGGGLVHRGTAHRKAEKSEDEETERGPETSTKVERCSHRILHYREWFAGGTTVVARGRDPLPSRDHPRE